MRMLLIPDDSPLRNPPAELNPIQKVGCDALRFALDMTHVSYLRLIQTLERIGESMRGESARVSEDITLALVDAWAVVDNLWRLQNIIRNFRGLAKTPDLEVHLRALAKVEDLRHAMQHLHERIKEVASGKDPLLGSLTWLWTPDDLGQPLRKGTVLLIAGGIGREGRMPLVNPGGRTVHRPIGLVTLSAFSCEIELTDLVARVVALAGGLDAGMRRATAGRTGGGSDFILAADIEFGDPTSVQAGEGTSAASA